MAAKTILIIEPDEQERRDLASVLNRLGYQTHEASSSADGLKLFNQERHDLVIVEALLSGMNGLKVCKIVKEQGKDWGIKTIVISKIFHSRSMQFEAFNKFMADAYLERPFTVSKLLGEIEHLIGLPNAADAAKAKIRRDDEKIVEIEREKSSSEEAEPPPATAHAAPPPTEPKIKYFETADPPDEGELGSDILCRVLAKLARDKAVGSFQLKHENITKQVFLIEGRPVFVKSSEKEETLGRMLLEDGVLTEEQYREAMVRMGESGKKFGTMVTRLGYLNNDDLYYHLVQQMRRKIARCFAWADGHYSLNREARYPADAPVFENDYVSVTLEGYRNYADAALLEQNYEEHKAHHLFLGDPAVVSVSRTRLNADETDLLRLADGSHTLGEVVGESKLGLMLALRLLNALLGLGALRLGLMEQAPRRTAAYGAEPPPAFECPETDPRLQARFREIKEFAVEMEDLDYFELLGVAEDAAAEIIRKAYAEQQKRFSLEGLMTSAPRRIARMCDAIHQHLNEAFAVLSDEKKRREYGQRKAAEKGQPKTSPREGAAEAPKAGVSPKQLFQDGVVALENNKYHAAVELLQKAALAEPYNLELHVKLAQAMYKLLSEPALTWIDVENAAKQVLAMDPNRADMLALVGQVKAKEGDHEKALQYLRKAADLDPRNEDLKRAMHYAESRLKEGSKKKSRLEK